MRPARGASPGGLGRRHLFDRDASRTATTAPDFDPDVLGPVDERFAHRLRLDTRHNHERDPSLRLKRAPHVHATSSSRLESIWSSPGSSSDPFDEHWLASLRGPFPAAHSGALM